MHRMVNYNLTQTERAVEAAPQTWRNNAGIVLQMFELSSHLGAVLANRGTMETWPKVKEEELKKTG